MKFEKISKPSGGIVRNTSRFLYQAEALFGGIILGIVSWYLSHWRDTEKYPGARLCFTEVFAGFAIMYGSIAIWTYNWFPICFAVINFIFSLAFFSAFGALIEFDCDKNWVGWEVNVGKGYKACWKTTEAFTFIAAFCFLVSTVFALMTKSATTEHHIHMMHRKASGTSSTAETQV
ncbi:uncharacterized protein Z520_12364 [Fonsecaea multimorphosa CBS 102226]|uniref:MARVEL domain-containing protein n=1 Tax=Fonsecaea multimorphosa CBS 102226 TaxID=1442371 RepID=A0A0D2K6D6_9EURO|nr:uncharacterized protein Z520_12364 [Fonsecaea multimorphosa CBS 102226]KIX91928.1 hypothetical protein Z520_12364 [Fonsecaea multimorphosa CBS 102226]OAL24919.1 hypothetical protein AYO22_05255 [Fonsecaea multimorphosa]